MKLLYCPHCHDLRAFPPDTLIECDCGKSSGSIDDKSFAAVEGSGRIVCIHNAEFLKAVASNDGKVEFRGWVLSKEVE